MIALTAGCSAGAVKTKSSPSFDVSAYRTYGWGTPAPIVIANEERERDAAVLEWTIRDTVDRTLAAKGYQQIVGGEPDFLVDFGIRLEEKSADTFGEYIKYRDEGGKQGLGGAFVFGYEEGTVAIEISDANSRARLWSGSQRMVFDDGQDVTKLERAVASILADFPARSGASGEVAPPPAPSSPSSSGTRSPSEPKRGDFYVPEP